jgi:DNA-binding NarL/FixJ family response regulator
MFPQVSCPRGRRSPDRAAGLALLINREPDLQVCGEAEEAQSAAQAIAALRPDIALVDISLGGPDGLELLKQLRGRDATLPVLILSMHDEAIYAERASAPAPTATS